MAILTFSESSYEVDHAVKGDDYVHGYNAAGECIVSIDGVTDFSAITYDGEYLTPEACFAEGCNEVRIVGGKLTKKDGTTVTAAAFAAGTFAGKMVANSTAAKTVTTAQVRNIYAGTADMTAKSTSLTSGTVYLVYE